MSFTRRTFRQLTAPGYFDFSAAQTAKTATMVQWFDLYSTYFQDQVNLYDRFFRQWMVTDYSAVISSVQLYLYTLGRSINFPWQADLNLNRDLIYYLLSPRPLTFSDCINQLYNLLVQIGWITSMGQVTAGKGVPINFAELLAVYSDSVSPPATPANTPYARRAWTPPAGWTMAPASSTYTSRGYLYNGEIVWLPPVSLAVQPAYYDVALLADLPGSANDGDIGGVFNDGSGDQGAVYTYYAGNWYKCSTVNSLQGSVFTNTNLDSSGLFAPDTDPPVTSQTPPPVSGPSQGFGFYGTYGVNPTAENLDLIITLTAEGNAHLGIIINLFRRIKPAVAIAVYMYATYMAATSVFQIKDLNAVN